MSTLKVNTVLSATTPTVLISDGLSVSGVSTLTGGLKVGTAVTISDNGNFGVTGIITASNVKDSKGELRNFPQVSVTSQHTIVASDAGKHIKNTSGGWIVNGSTGFAVGDVCRVVNASGSSQVVTQSGVTLYSRRDGGVSGNHSIAARGAAIIICTGSNEYYVSGDI